MNKEKYIKDVLKNIDADRKMRDRIREDLMERISMAEDQDPFFDVVKEIGHPHDLAKEFNDNLDQKGVVYVSVGSFNVNPYEYKSKQTLFGLPLIHINTGGRYRTVKAKGIIAIGDVATGVVAIGGVSFGLVSIGGVAIGAVGLGGVAVGAVALGGVAVGVVALGGVAIGLAKVFGAVSTLLLK